MNAFDYYLAVLKNYVGFDGRARRSEYWYFTLFSTIISLVLSGIDLAMNTNFLNPIYSLGILIPSIAAIVRRMHDVGKSGWYSLIPLYNLYLACQDGEPRTNQYGLDPKGRGVNNAEDAIRSIGQDL